MDATHTYLQAYEAGANYCLQVDAMLDSSQLAAVALHMARENEHLSVYCVMGGFFDGYRAFQPAVTLN